jgi:ATP-dependent DNA helicase RecG
VRLLSLLRDRDLIGEARESAEEMLATDPSLSSHPLLRDMVGRFVSDDRAEFLQKG